MRLDSISGVGAQAAETLYTEGNYRTAEAVAYGFGPEVVSLDGIDANIFLNAQELVASKGGKSAERVLEQQNYFCENCGMDGGLGGKFNNETACLSHMETCGGIR